VIWGQGERQARRWTTQWQKTEQQPLAQIAQVIHGLSTVPVGVRGSIVHVDYSFTNIMFRRDQPTRMQAALDSTGEPASSTNNMGTTTGKVLRNKIIGKG